MLFEKKLVATCSNCGHKITVESEVTPAGWYYYGRVADPEGQDAYMHHFHQESCAIEFLITRWQTVRKAEVPPLRELTSVPSKPRLSERRTGKGSRPSLQGRPTSLGQSKKAIGEANASKILDILSVGPATHYEIAAVAEMNEGTVYGQLTRLLEAGRVTKIQGSTTHPNVWQIVPPKVGKK